MEAHFIMKNYSSATKPDKSSVVVNLEYFGVNSDGEIVFEKRIRKRHKNRSGFVMMYTEKMIDFIRTTSQGGTVRLFLYLASRQGYGDDGVFGFRTSRKHLAEFLHVDAKTVYTSINYLVDKFLVNVLRIDGALEFMVNPDYVTIGSDRKSRDREWSARWAFYWKHVADKDPFPIKLN